MPPASTTMLIKIKDLTWDQWNFNECDERFGDDWPGRIPAQLIAHTLYYFTERCNIICKI